MMMLEDQLIQTLLLGGIGDALHRQVLPDVLFNGGRPAESRFEFRHGGISKKIPPVAQQKVASPYFSTARSLETLRPTARWPGLVDVSFFKSCGTKIAVPS
jgi:hypothetical protein